MLHAVPGGFEGLLRQMLGQVSISVDRRSLKILYVLIVSPEGDWQRIEFSKVEKDL